MNAPAPTDQHQAKFDEYFTQGAEFWTSEDGSRTDLVIKVMSGARPPFGDPFMREREALFRYFYYLKGVDWSKHLRERYVEWAPLPEEFFDSVERAEDDRFGWQFTDTPTPFKVVTLELT